MSSSASISMRVPIWNPTLIGLDFPLAALTDIIRKRKILTYTQEIQQEQILSDYAQQDLSVVTQKPQN
jgi:hypothetical protein